MRRETDHDLCGKASCGCVYHAEEGVPCMHDLELALSQKVITQVDYDERTARLHPVPVLVPVDTSMWVL